MRFFLCLILAVSLTAQEPEVLEKEANPLPVKESKILDKGTYTAEVGSIPVKDREGKEKGQITYICYAKEGPLQERPITFAFNGGPGSSSVWLHLGAFGPRRVVTPEEGQSVAPPYQIVDNEESILDLTDLVFIDPIGTGLSRANTLEDAKPYYDVHGDIEAIGNFIRDFLTEKQCWNSPLYLAGESYGSSRACGLSQYLQSEHGIYLNGLILISCAIDFRTLFSDYSNPLPYFLHFPTYVASAWYHGRYRPEATLEEVVAEARTFAYETYAPFLFRPHLNPVEREQFFEQFALMTGLPHEVVQRDEGKVLDAQYLIDFFPGQKKKLGHYDTRCVGNYIHPYSAPFFQDPSVAPLAGIFSTALHDYLHHELECPSSYAIFSMEAHRHWTFHSESIFGFPSFLEALRGALVTNPELKLFVGSGYYDLVTPFAATEFCFDQLDSYHRENIQSEYYEGGHMFYSNPSARKKFKEDLTRFFQRK